MYLLAANLSAFACTACRDVELAQVLAGEVVLLLQQHLEAPAQTQGQQVSQPSASSAHGSDQPAEGAAAAPGQEAGEEGPVDTSAAPASAAEAASQGPLSFVHLTRLVMRVLQLPSLKRGASSSNSGKVLGALRAVYMQLALRQLGQEGEMTLRDYRWALRCCFRHTCICACLGAADCMHALAHA